MKHVIAPYFIVTLNIIFIQLYNKQIVYVMHYNLSKTNYLNFKQSGNVAYIVLQWDIIIFLWMRKLLKNWQDGKIIKNMGFLQ